MGQVKWGARQKDSRKSNLGKPFEEFLVYANNRYKIDKIAVIHKIPTSFTPIRDNEGKISTVKPDEKPPMDYMGRYRSRPIAYEAKHTKEKRIDLKAVDENQTEWLDDWAVDPQAITFVMVSFNLQRFFAVPWEAWKVARQARELNRKDLGYGWFGPEICGVKAHYTWNATGMASISVEEMHPAWEVKVGGIAGLDYLKTIDRIF